MGKDIQITFMQARIVRLATQKWHLTMQSVNALFLRYGIYAYIEKFWDLFHIEGDMAVLQDVRQYLEKKGATIGN